jgi:hypothetical protein
MQHRYEDSLIPMYSQDYGRVAADTGSPPLQGDSYIWEVTFAGLSLHLKATMLLLWP